MTSPIVMRELDPLVEGRGEGGGGIVVIND